MRLHKIRGLCFLPSPIHLCGENWRTAAAYWGCLWSRHLIPLPTPCPTFWGRKRAIALGENTLWTKLISPALTPSSLPLRSEEHTSELQSLMRISYAVLYLKNKLTKYTTLHHEQINNTET